MAGRHNITIQTIAERVGVSKATISRYLNGKYEFMSEETRRKIERAISETGYRPNKMAGSLKTARSNLIGLVLADPTANLTPFLVSSICDSCALHGQKMIVVSTRGDADREREQVMDLLDQQVDGLIVTTGDNFDFYQRLDRERLPVVLADRVPANSQLDWVAVNHYQCSAEVTEWLIDQGFRRIVVVLRANRSQKGTIMIREKSVADTCLFRFGEEGRCTRVLIDGGDGDSADCSSEDILRCLRSCAEDRRTPTAIFVADGILMGRFLCGLYQLGLSISPSFTICGYDVWNFGSMLSHQVCTIEQPLAKMGTIASELLLERLSGGEREGLQRHVLLDCQVKYPDFVS